ASLKRNAAAEPMLNAQDAPKLVEQYLAGADPRTPYASALYGDPTGLPPVLIQVGSDEILLDDAVRMAEKLRAAGRPVELEIFPRMPHVWHAFAPFLPEARRSRPPRTGRWRWRADPRAWPYRWRASAA